MPKSSSSVLVAVMIVLSITLVSHHVSCGVQLTVDTGFAFFT